LDSLREGSKREGARLLPVVIPIGPGIDSIAAVLRSHRLDRFEVVDPEAFVTLRVRQVPVVLGITGEGEVSFVSSPGSPDNWPFPSDRVSSESSG
jgi:hypothetical protein